MSLLATKQSEISTFQKERSKNSTFLTCRT